MIDIKKSYCYNRYVVISINKIINKMRCKKMIKAELLYQEYLFTEGINEETGECHAATVAICDGKPTAAWFGGIKEKNPNVRIWFAKRDEKWSTPVAITPDDGEADWNPTLFAEDGVLTLIYKSGIDEGHWYSMKSVSTDCGETWTEPKELVPGDVGGRGPVKNQMIRLSNGALLAPGSTEDLVDRWESWTDYSDDNGETWKLSAPVAFTLPDGTICNRKEELPKEGEGLIQPAVWEDQAHDGRVYMLARTNLNWVYRSESTDFGKTWSVARPTDMPNNNSGIGAAITDCGVLGLICNPVSENWGDRTPLCLFLSEDNGATYPVNIELETEKGVEFSYPSIVAEGNLLHMVYTCGRKKIGYAVVRVER